MGIGIEIDTLRERERDRKREKENAWKFFFEFPNTNKQNINNSSEFNTVVFAYGKIESRDKLTLGLYFKN